MWLSLLAAVGAAFSLVWPLPEPRIERRFEPPPKPWSAGHRGVDLAGPAGQEVVASGPGTIAFAGTVAGRGVVSLVLDGGTSPPLRTTYEPVEPEVSAGERVSAGQPVGTLQAAAGHCGRRVCLHWGLLRGERYLDPLAYVHPVRPVLLPVPSREPTPPTDGPTQTTGDPGAEEGSGAEDDSAVEGRRRAQAVWQAEPRQHAESWRQAESGAGGEESGTSRPTFEDPAESVVAISDRTQPTGAENRPDPGSFALTGPSLALTAAALWAGHRIRAGSPRTPRSPERSRAGRRRRARRSLSRPPRGVRPGRRAAPSPQPPR
ncbi:M23 family metallopeptidase [Streptomyces sp. XM4193]|uniref:M23 family metallopeptidase n=1 Tax=Streptomyces sp. XM4193 TaxID=2929782 RepID=UPI0035AB8791